MKGPVPEAWHTSTISPQENVNYVTDNVGTEGSQVSCEVHGTTHREFLESFFSEMAQFVKFVGAKLIRYNGGQL